MLQKLRAAIGQKYKQNAAGSALSAVFNHTDMGRFCRQVASAEVQHRMWEKERDKRAEKGKGMPSYVPSGLVKIFHMWLNDMLEQCLQHFFGHLRDGESPTMEQLRFYTETLKSLFEQKGKLTDGKILGTSKKAAVLWTSPRYPQVHPPAALNPAAVSARPPPEDPPPHDDDRMQETLTNISKAINVVTGEPSVDGELSMKDEGAEHEAPLTFSRCFMQSDVVQVAGACCSWHYSWYYDCCDY